jgi:hypothetical protein
MIEFENEVLDGLLCMISFTFGRMSMPFVHGMTLCLEKKFFF